MSFFSNIVKNVKEFYSEINAATLTGAIDVIVIQGEDGSFKSSPFHVRFGKLGVLKAREKIVDLEINGEPVSIQMKLDDNGAAFFVEEVEGDDWSPDLATSPIPSSSGWEFREMELHSQNKDLTGKEEVVYHKETPAITLPPELQTTDTCGEDEREEGKRGKLNKKKRRRRNQFKHGRKGSKSSLKEIATESEQDMFTMDDVNDADLEEDFSQMEGRTKEHWDSGNGTWPNKKTRQRMPRNFSLEFANSFALGPGCSTPNTSTGNSTPLDLGSTPVTAADPLASSAPMVSQFANLCEELNIENSLIGSRVPLIPKSSSEAETLEAILNDNIPEIEIHRPKSVSASFHYFSDTDAENNSPPLCSRPPSPGVTSDSEIEKGAREEQTSWRWGELPSPYQNVVNQVTEVEEKRELEKESSLLGWFRTDKKIKEEKTEDVKGVYLDDLISGQVDPQTAAIYLSPSLLHTNDNVDSNIVQDPLLVTEESKDSILPESDAQEEDSSIIGVEPNNDVTAPHYKHVKDIKKENLIEEEKISTVNDSTTSGLVVDIRQREEDCESGHGPSLPMSPQSGIITQAARSRNFNSDSEDDFPGIVSRHIPDFAISLCGGLLSEKGITPDEFNAKYISHLDFVSRLREDKDLLSNPNVVVRVNEKYLSWSAAAPIVLSILLYKEPLPSDLVTDLTKEGLSVNLSLEAKEAKEGNEAEKCEKKVSSSWFTWFGSSANSTSQVKMEKDIQQMKTEEKMEPTAEPVQVPQEQPNSFIKEGEASSSDGELDGKRCRKTLRLASDKLKELNLKPGSNEVQFSVTTAFQGTTRCKCHIYLWKHTDKVVISDIDGTITKSDVLGHILPVIGRDWAQSGVAQLFTKIRNNGYHIMYLSARAIGQASITKDYLQSVKQGDVCLPDGPLFLNPESLIHAFRKEVIDRNPEEFKIRCLKDIQSLFEGRNPFFAGYGNRPNDAYAYRAVGIPVSRIFTINPAGELRHELTQNFQTSYVYQSQIADMFFPPVGKDGFNPDFRIQDFSDFGFWRDPIPEVETPQEEQPKKS